MPINTYVELKKETVTTPVASVTISGIDQGYTDLVLVANGSTTTAGRSLLVKFNSDSTSIYSDTGLYGTGSGSGTSYKTPNNTVIGAGEFFNYNTTTILNFPGYSNTTTWKNLIGRANSASNYVQSFVGLRRDTSAITSITLSVTSDTFAAGTTFSLHGIKAWANTETSPKATGGYVSSDSSYWYHAFPFSSTFTPNQSLTADVLVVAGGGGGGSWTGGGGGAGGVIAFASQSLTATSYNCTVGAGGRGGEVALTPSSGVNGSNSVFGALTAAVGGAGGQGYPNSNLPLPTGGSGGGGTTASPPTPNGSAGTPGQGFAGGNGIGGTIYSGGGGGGAGGVGTTATNSLAGFGGPGTNSVTNWGSLSSVLLATNFGNNGYIAGGGGGGVYITTAPSGGIGGGGAGGEYTSTPASNGKSGVSATGSGGGGGGSSGSDGGAGGAGGSGLIIVRYAK